MVHPMRDNMKPPKFIHTKHRKSLLEILIEITDHLNKHPDQDIILIWDDTFILNTLNKSG